jgi:hypothetical protein
LISIHKSDCLVLSTLHDNTIKARLLNPEEEFDLMLLI